MVCLVFMACQKKEDINTPNFEVQAESITVKLGKEAKFNFNGDADFINFYSGERGNDYDFREGRIEEADVLLSFETQALNNRSGTQDNQLSVKIFSNFNEASTITDLETATNATDITSSFRMAKIADNNEFVASGKVNISKYIEDGKTFHIGFRYVTNPKSTHGVSPNFNRIRTFLLESVSKAGETTTLANHSNAGIIPPKDLIRSLNYQSGRASLTATYINFFGNTAADINQDGVPDDEITTVAWAMTNGFSIQKLANLGIDKAISVKTVANASMKTYAHTYKKEGNYVAVFVAKNANVFAEKDVIKKINITVIP